MAVLALAGIRTAAMTLIVVLTTPAWCVLLPLFFVCSHKMYP
jgi:hypothetical protein